MRYQGETDEQQRDRQENNYKELESHGDELKEIMRNASPKMFEFMQWMIDVYAAEQCGRYRTRNASLIRGWPSEDQE